MAAILPLMVSPPQTIVAIWTFVAIPFFAITTIVSPMRR